MSKRLAFIIVAFTGIALGMYFWIQQKACWCEDCSLRNGTVTAIYGGEEHVYEVKDCFMHGINKNYGSNNRLKEVAYYTEGSRHGTSDYFNEDNIRWRHEFYEKGTLLNFWLLNLADSSLYSFKNDTLKVTRKTFSNSLHFAPPVIMKGNDEPFTLLYKNNLIIRGETDLYVIDSNLNIQINLRDTLLKYIPTAYEKKIIDSKPHYFNWHRNIIGDSLHVKVFYDQDKYYSNGKQWEAGFLLKP